MFCDDGEAKHADLSLHCPTIPEGFPQKRFFSGFQLLHLEGLNIRQQIKKYNDYYDVDYALNKSPELSLKRYLPKMLQLLEVLKPNAPFAPVSSESDALIKTYFQEFDSKNLVARETKTPDFPAIFQIFKISV